MIVFLSGLTFSIQYKSSVSQISDSPLRPDSDGFSKSPAQCPIIQKSENRKRWNQQEYGCIKSRETSHSREGSSSREASNGREAGNSRKASNRRKAISSREASNTVAWEARKSREVSNCSETTSSMEARNDTKKS